MVGRSLTVTTFSSVTVSNSPMELSTMEESCGPSAARIFAIKASWSTVFFFLSVVVNSCCPREVVEVNLLLFDEDPDDEDEEVEEDDEDTTPLDEELEGRISR